MIRLVTILGLCFSFLFSENIIEYDYELDAYYSNVSAFIDLDRKHNISNEVDKSEKQIYQDLILNSFNPNIFLIEAAIFPMPITGVYIKNSFNNFYNNAQYNKQTNLIQAVTAGFEEPYSLSFFIGRMVVFKKKSHKRVGKNRAYLGLLFSIGDCSIKDNLLHKNNWLNVEYKLKGTRDKEDSDLDWSFRIGYKVNENHNFVDTLYFGARRSSTDFKKDRWSLIYNSAFSSLIEFSADSFDLTKTEFLFEKKYPFVFKRNMVFGLVVGYIYRGNNRYRGSLKDEGIENHQIVFRPNLEF